jgi:hypothetical protein
MLSVLHDSLLVRTSHSDASVHGSYLTNILRLASRLGVDSSRLGGVVVSMLATGPKACGFEPGQGD